MWSPLNHVMKCTYHIMQQGHARHIKTMTYTESEQNLKIPWFTSFLHLEGLFRLIYPAIFISSLLCNIHTWKDLYFKQKSLHSATCFHTHNWFQLSVLSCNLKWYLTGSDNLANPWHPCTYWTQFKQHNVNFTNLLTRVLSIWNLREQYFWLTNGRWKNCAVTMAITVVAK